MEVIFGALILSTILKATGIWDGFVCISGCL